MTHDREFTKHGVLTLYTSTDQTDIDLFVKIPLVPATDADADADPDASTDTDTAVDTAVDTVGAGVPIKVSQGWLRASHRAEDPEPTSEMRPFHQDTQVEPLVPGEIHELRVELLPMSFLARRGRRTRLEITNQDSLIADAPMTHFYGAKVGTDAYHHDRTRPSTLRLHERPPTEN